MDELRPQLPDRPHDGARPARQVRARRAFPLALILLLLGAMGACEDVVVRPADVMAVRVSPDQAQLGVGGTMRLTAEVLDGQDRPLIGYQVAWSSDDEAVATVNDQGDVTATGDGSTTIRARAGSAEGTAALTVQAGPALVVEPASVAFAVDEGSSPPAPIAVAVRNGGSGSLTGLGVSTSYEGSQTGWLSTTLSGQSAPATLSLRATPGSLGPGSYSATVQVSSPSASNSPVAVLVSLEVRDGSVGGGGTTVPTAPSGLSATATSASRIALEWSDNSANETEFRIERKTGSGSFAQVATVGTDVETFTDTGLAGGTAYSYQVRACNGAGCSAYTSAASATTPAAASPPAAPSGLAATTAGPDRIDVAWVDNSGDEAEFRLERQAPGESTFHALVVLPANTTSYADASVQPDGRYEYRVRACSDGGCSAFSATAGTFTPPIAPAQASASTLSGTEIRVEWSDLSITETRFEIQRRKAGGSFEPRGTVNADQTTFTDTGLDEGTTYTYRIRACNTGGCSNFTNEATAVTLSPVPPTPSGVDATFESGVIRVSWTDGSIWETRYEIERSRDGSVLDIQVTGPDVTSYDDGAIESDALYTYRVRACNPVGCSEWSAEASAETPPSAPSNLRAQDVRGSRIKIRWNDTSSRETLFRIERARGANEFTFLVNVDANKTEYEDKSVSEETTYRYVVYACNPSGCSAPSNILTVTTDDD